MSDDTNAAAYHARIARWLVRILHLVLNLEQWNGFECIGGCGYNQLRDHNPARVMYVAALPEGGRGQLFVCGPCDDLERAAAAERAARRRSQAEICDAVAEAASDAPIHHVVDQAPGSAIVDLGGGDHVTVADEDQLSLLGLLAVKRSEYPDCHLGPVVDELEAMADAPAVEFVAAARRAFAAQRAARRGGGLVFTHDELAAVIERSGDA